MADAQTLQYLFNSGNPFFVNQGYDLLNQSQKRGATDIANIESEIAARNALTPAQVAHTQALAGQAKETARATRLKNDVEDAVPLSDRTAAYFSDLRKKMSDNDIAQMGNQMEALRHYTAKAAAGNFSLEDQATVQKNYPGMIKFLVSPQGIAAGQKAYDAYVKSGADYVKSMDQAKEHTKASLGAASIGAKASLESMRMQIDAGRFLKPWMGGISARIDAENDPVKKQGLLIDAMQKALAEGDQQTAQYFKERAVALDALVSKKTATLPKPGEVAKGGLGGIPVNPPVSSVPNATPRSPANTPKMTMQQLQTMYPGVPADKLKEAFKKKFGVDVE